MVAPVSTPEPATRGGVQMTAELRRILAIPRRVWSTEEAGAMAAELTAILRTPRGAMALRPIQAIALYEAGTQGGMFGAIGVGHGKTLLSLLTPNVMDSKRPLLLVPAKLVAKTKREARLLAQHWRLPNFMRIESYELLGRTQAAELLARYMPDLIVCDESHRLKSPKAAVTRRVMRYLGEHPECRLVAMSGTITTRSLRDYAHLLARSVPDSPLPRSWSELEEWSDALDEKPRAESRMGVGALIELCNAEERAAVDKLSGVRRAYRRRFSDSPGVIATVENTVEASLSITSVEPTMSRETDEAFRRLRGDWALPNDEEPIADGISLWRHARELALGFYYKWDPAPPKEWLAARKAWASDCRYILQSNRRDLDSELQVAQAVMAGHYPSGTLRAWQAIRDAFKPNTVPVWIDDGAVRKCAAWGGGAAVGIIWTEHNAFAERLSEFTGWDYYGAQGVNAKGEPIEAARPNKSIIASIASNGEGRNLQAWSRNLITSMPANGRTMEQLLGRTHRPGQLADEVTYEVLVSCREHADAFTRACADARFIEDSTGQPQKLLFADVDMAVKEQR